MRLSGKNGLSMYADIESMFEVSGHVRVWGESQSIYTVVGLPLARGYLMLVDTDPSCHPTLICSALTGSRAVYIPHYEVGVHHLDLLHASSGSLIFACAESGDVRLVNERILEDDASRLMVVPSNTFCRDSDAAASSEVKLFLVGAGPGGRSLSKRALGVCASADAVVSFDRISDEIRSHIGPEVPIIDFPYVYDRFDESIEAALSAVVKAGDSSGSKIAVVVEGNPEVFDVGPSLVRAGWSVVVVPAMPISVESAAILLRSEGIELRDHAVVSGLVHRHPSGKRGWLFELGEYMKLKIPCVLVEMFPADLNDLGELLDSVDGEVRVIGMINMFTDAETVWEFSKAGFADGLYSGAIQRGDLMSILLIAE